MLSQWKGNKPAERSFREKQDSNCRKTFSKVANRRLKIFEKERIVMIEWTGRGTDELKRFQKGSQEIGIFELSNLFGITTEALR